MTLAIRALNAVLLVKPTTTLPVDTVVQVFTRLMTQFQTLQPGQMQCRKSDNPNETRVFIRFAKNRTEIMQYEFRFPTNADPAQPQRFSLVSPRNHGTYMTFVQSKQGNTLILMNEGYKVWKLSPEAMAAAQTFFTMLSGQVKALSQHAALYPSTVDKKLPKVENLPRWGGVILF